MMQKKTSYKLHKVKKQWVTLAGTATVLSLALLSSTGTKADEQTATVDRADAGTTLVTTDTATGATGNSEQATAPVQSTDQGQTETTTQQEQTNSESDKTTSQNWTAIEKASQPSQYAPTSTQANTAVNQATTSVPDNTQPKDTTQVAATTTAPQSAAALNGWVTDPNTGETYYYRDGEKLISSSLQDGDKLYHLNQSTGALIKNTWYFQDGSPGLSHWYYLGNDGLPLTGHQTIDGQNYYFYKSGVQSKGEFLKDGDGKLIMTDANSGVVTSNFEPSRFYTTGDNKWYYVDDKGELASGWQTINGQTLYFDSSTNVQAKGTLTQTADGKSYYFDQDTGDVWTNRFVQVPTYDYRGIRPGGRTGYAWVYLTADGSAASGLTQTPEGQTLYFDTYNHYQVKGRLVNTDGNNYRYFDAETGDMWRNRTYTESGVTYNIDANGIATKVQ